MKIYVSNLSFNVNDEDLRNYFSPYGEVTSASIVNDRESGRSRGFGFVEMSDANGAKQAIQALNGGTVEGRTVNVAEARPKEDRPARSGSSNGGYKRNPFRMQ